MSWNARPLKKPGQKARGSNRPLPLTEPLDDAELAGSRIEEPEFAAMHPRRMRHRQAFADDGAGPNVDDDTAVGAPVAPAVGHVLTGSPR